MGDNEERKGKKREAEGWRRGGVRRLMMWGRWSRRKTKGKDRGGAGEEEGGGGGGWAAGLGGVCFGGTPVGCRGPNYRTGDRAYLAAPLQSRTL